MATLQQGEQLVRRIGDCGAKVGIGDSLERAEDIMGVFGTLLRDLSRRNDGLRLVDGELGPFNEVGEVGLEERQRGRRLVEESGQGGGDFEVSGDRGEEGGQLVEAGDAIGVVFVTGCPCGEQAPAAGSSFTSSGQLRVVAGSHRAPIQPAFVRRRLDLPQIDLPARTGDVTVHLSCTLHMSRHRSLASGA